MVTHSPDPQSVQQNGYDCGLYTILSVDCISDSLPCKFREDQFPTFRYNVAAALLRGGWVDFRLEDNYYKPIPAAPFIKWKPQYSELCSTKAFEWETYGHVYYYQLEQKLRSLAIENETLKDRLEGK